MANNNTPRIKGTTYDFGTKILVIPPLSLGALDRFREALETAAPEPNTIVDVTHAALVRNYPDMTRDEVADLVDLDNMEEVFSIVMNVSNLLAKHGASPQAKTKARSTSAKS